MSLDFCLEVPGMVKVYERSITHNLTDMAREAGVYQALWRPTENPAFKTAGDLIPVLRRGYDDLKARPDHYRRFNAPDGWGTYEAFVQFVAATLNACMEYPHAITRACV